MTYSWATSTHPGLVRDSNEDSVLPDSDGRDGGPVLVAVADGMGGHAAGEVASRLAIEAVANSEAPLEERIAQANQAVMEASERRPDQQGMGTTLTVGDFRPDGTLLVGHVGDSRLYLFRGENLLQVTRDHSLVAEYVASGALSPEEAATHPQRNVITRALGIDWEIDVDSHTVNLRIGDRVLVCSDGLTNMVADADIARILSEQPAAQAAGWALIEAANQAGGEDNITVAIVDVVE
ncbi:MAG: Stp1/IreP family PP2C-type Ser/Thr phosphatase [Acidimicrobiia bacterium]|nr:Stp1/IreP family PP2C-type Ser/Thr phosphatase [Acidimicrobiia bacterium]MBT8216809.1 Stp1/IreP family PP2C-type Ser/Thr phosphatase [Acidimicrobiia bacterium]NNF08701.1 Stp1/IreP family PP2C-type Ser/Thr phosphatase [Acidimicrobiia bacterium]NNL69890.1 Stp1/IreP family PP2C-type Ser/Thr phosphatase [Acidimicrobiia bacterium]